MYLAQAQSQWFSNETFKFPKNPTIWILGWAMAPLPPGHDAPVNMSRISLSSLEMRTTALNPNCYNFKKLSVLVQNYSFLAQLCIF